MEHKDSRSSSSPKRERSSRSSRHSRDRSDSKKSRSPHRKDKDGKSRSSTSSSSSKEKSTSRQKSSGSGSSSDPSHRETVVKEAVASVILNERSKYETKIRESTVRLKKYTNENDRLLDEVSNLRIQIREMQGDRSELVRAHQESMSLLAQVSEEKLIEFKSKSEQEASESKAAQEEALRTVLEMMEKDCEDRVAELDQELARIEEERNRATQLQIEAESKVAREEMTKQEYEEACRLAVYKLVQERQARGAEMQELNAREKQLLRELEETKAKAERDKKAATAAAVAALASDAITAVREGNNDDDGDGMGNNRVGGNNNIGSGGYAQGAYQDAYPGEEGSHGSASYSHSSYGESTAEGSSSGTGSSAMSPLIPLQQNNMPQSQLQSSLNNGPTNNAKEAEAQSKRPPIINRRYSAKKYQESIFLQDPTYEMTRGRKIALSLQNYSWYQPRGGSSGSKKHWDVNGLGLQSAWAYFEHSVLPRYIVKNDDGSLPTGNARATATATFPDESEKEVASVYEPSEIGSSVYNPDRDGNIEAASEADSDTSDWLYKPTPKKKSRSSSSHGGGIARSGSSSQKGDLTRAAPGESTVPTRLYSPVFTPLSQMGDFGLGVGLYFSSLRGIALITLIAGLINLPNILYFAGDDYSAGQPGVSLLLKGSAICTEQVWVPCPTCEVDDFDRARDRIAGAITVSPDGELQTLVFALKNACDGATMNAGIINMASLVFILLGVVALSLYQRRKQIQFDEQQQTAQDYSIEIWNPPGDATEPEEWKEFFETRFGGHMTCCTVTKDNDLLVRALAERREVLARIEEKVREGSSVSTLSLSELAARIEHGRKLIANVKSRVAPGIPELVGRLTVLNTKVQGLAQQHYNATRVFCTFETEKTQRKVLQEMTVGSITAYKNKTHTVDPKVLFRGEHVLLVREAEEPNTIRWMDLDEKLSTRIKQITFTTLISLVCIFAVAVIVTLCRQISAAAAALAISISNAVFPFVAKIITNFEAHASETGKQSSLYVKIAIFRWVITAIVITVIIPFTSTLTNGPEHLITSIYIIFFADLVTTNALQVIDPVSNFQRHFLAPRAGSQERMNLLMGGTEYTIAERYTNMTKTLFLTFYYSAIYPSAFFMCALTLTVNFFIDKFSLMRTWQPAPMLGPGVAKFSTIYFMTTAIAAMAITSSYLFSGFPYDNLCAEDVSHSAYYGSWQITDGDGKSSTADVEPGERSYHFCNQFLGPSSGNFAFPVLPGKQPSGSKWMTEEQEQLTGLYGIVSVSVLGLVGLVFVYRLFRATQGLFSASHKPNGDDQGQPFSEVENISSYIPQVTSAHFTHPLLAVNIDYVGEKMFDWHDPDRSHSYYDLTRDAEQLLKGDEDTCYSAFGQIRHWPQNESNDVEDERGEGKTTRSALRRNRDNSLRRNVSWSSKVTCKTYSKDDPNYNDFFNANASTTKGMNFDGHADPLYDPHAQNEARVAYEKQENEKVQNDARDSSNQPTLAEQFDPYYNTGLDYENQQPDQMYGDSQAPDTNIKPEERSYDHSSSASYSQSSGGSYDTSDNNLSESSETSSYSQHQNEYDGNEDENSASYGDMEESTGGSSASSAHHGRNGVESPQDWQEASYTSEHSHSQQSSQHSSKQSSQQSSQQSYYEEKVYDENDQNSDFNQSENSQQSYYEEEVNDENDQNSDFNQSENSQQSYYEEEGYDQNEQNWGEDGTPLDSGSFSEEASRSSDDESSSEGLLPPVT